MGSMISWMTFAGLMLIAPSVSARTYVVATHGDDGGDGDTARPFRTLQRGADAAGPGDVVLAMPGEYAGFSIDGKDGRADRPLVFRGAPGAHITRPGPPPGRLPLNTATDTYVWPRWPHGITIQRSSYVVVEGFEISGMPGRESDASGALLHKGGAGVYGGASRHLTFRRDHSHDNGRWGIFTSFCDDTVVEDSVVSGSKIEHGIYLSNSADRAIVRRNHIFGNNQAGIQINADNTFDDDDYRRFADPDGVSQGNVIEANVIDDNGAGGAAAINLDGVSDSIVRANLILGNHATGIALGQIEGRTGSQRNQILANWIEMAAGARWGILWLGCQPDDVDGPGHCISADEPRLPEWSRRPRALASGSTGNTLVDNVVLSASVENGSLYSDRMSLARDAVSGQETISDANVIVDRLALNSDTLAYTPIVLDVVAWRGTTGLDLHSITVRAAR
jgi:parallel beta-helix repeat protein